MLLGPADSALLCTIPTPSPRIQSSTGHAPIGGWSVWPESAPAGMLVFQEVLVGVQGWGGAGLGLTLDLQHPHEPLLLTTVGRFRFLQAACECLNPLAGSA